VCDERAVDYDKELEISREKRLNVEKFGQTSTRRLAAGGRRWLVCILYIFRLGRVRENRNGNNKNRFKIRRRRRIELYYYYYCIVARCAQIEKNQIVAMRRRKVSIIWPAISRLHYARRGVISARMIHLFRSPKRTKVNR